jgi:phage-related protein
MATFPLLSSGAVTQYPTESSVGQSVGIIRFLDGSDQRFLCSGRRFRRWQINLDLLSDEEIAALELFFSAQKGLFSSFMFTDPASNSQIPNCRFAISEMTAECLGPNASSTSFWIMETNG